MSYYDEPIKCEHSHSLPLSLHVHMTLFILVLPEPPVEGHLIPDNLSFPGSHVKWQGMYTVFCRD